jgi:hypothetical protein
MCDSSSSIKGYITSTDVRNAEKYARMKIMYEMSQLPEYQDKLEWVNLKNDGTSTYLCPPGLTCKEGYFRIKTKNECNRLSNFAQYMNSEEPEPGPDNGYYLEWRNDNDGVGQCYLGNPDFRKTCMTGNFDPASPNYGKGVILNNGLRYDENSGRCLITRKYCDSTAQYGYKEPDSRSPLYPDGGSCDLSAGQKWVDFFFGTTVSRGLYGAKCFK